MRQVTVVRPLADFPSAQTGSIQGRVDVGRIAGERRRCRRVDDGKLLFLTVAIIGPCISRILPISAWRRSTLSRRHSWSGLERLRLLWSIPTLCPAALNALTAASIF
jgi:hypothetical protein